MYRRHGQKLGLVFLACDLAATAVVWFGAYLLRYAAWPAPKGIPEFRLVLEGLPTVLILAAVLSAARRDSTRARNGALALHARSR
jgi:hypothetical protein